jgi:hypothetical protein
MIYYQNKPVKLIAVDQSLISVVSVDRPLSHEIWVNASDLTADEGLTEILDRAKEVEEWQTEHGKILSQIPLSIKRQPGIK